MNPINDYIKNLRLEKKLSTIELGRLSGVSSPHISRLERAERNATPATLKKLAQPLGTTYENLMQIAGFIKPDLTLVETGKEGVTLYLVKELISKKIITDENNIPEDVMNLILAAVKLEVKFQREAQEESE